MILKELAPKLDKIFNKSSALDWDMVGLQIGNLDKKINKIFITLDTNRDAVKEAIILKSDLIISHHPLIFSPIETLVSENIIQNKIIDLIENKIAVYIAHTNYDIMPGGLNENIANKFDLIDISTIEPQYEKWYKFVVFVPKEYEEKIREVICSHGGGKWRNYSCCTFNTSGRGTFKPMKGSKPYIGDVGSLNVIDEVRIECVVNQSCIDDVVKSVVEVHPYEEAAYDVYRIENKFPGIGAGRLGELKSEESLSDFFKIIKDKMKIKNFRWLAGRDINLKTKEIKKIAIINGSANSLVQKLIASDCDLIVLGEISYHNALNLIENGKIVVDIGHGESEKLAIDNIYKKLRDYFKKNNFRISLIKSKVGFNEWGYCIE